MKVAGIVLAVVLMLASLVGLVDMSSFTKSKRRSKPAQTEVSRANAPTEAAKARPELRSKTTPASTPAASSKTSETGAARRAPVDPAHDASNDDERNEARSTTSELGVALEERSHDDETREQEDPTSNESAIGGFEAPGRLVVATPAVPRLSFVVRDAGGAPLTNSSVLARYTDANSCETFESTSDADGTVSLPMRAGVAIAFEVRAPGHATGFAGPLALEGDAPRAFGFTLARGRELSGVVSREGTGVETFELAFWPQSNEGLSSHRSIVAHDGSFTFDEWPEGPLGVAVFAPDGAASVLQIDGTAPIDAKLTAPLMLRGRIANAPRNTTVQAWVASRGFAVLEAGEPIAVDADGSFEWPGAPRDGVVRIHAEGFAPQLASYDASGELGPLELDRRHALEIRLDSTDGHDASGYALSGWGVEDLPITSFDAQGVVRFDHVAAGRYTWTLHFGDGTATTFEHTLAPHRDWIVELRAR